MRPRKRFSAARKYAAALPTIPPPTTATSACSTTVRSLLDVIPTLDVIPAKAGTQFTFITQSFRGGLQAASAEPMTLSAPTLRGDLGARLRGHAALRYLRRLSQTLTKSRPAAKSQGCLGAAFA